MQWYDWYTGGEGLYCASEDVTHQTVGLHIERDAKLNVLRFGFIRYPMIDAGERFTMAPSTAIPIWATGTRARSCTGPSWRKKAALCRPSIPSGAGT